MTLTTLARVVSGLNASKAASNEIDFMMKKNSYEVAMLLCAKSLKALRTASIKSAKSGEEAKGEPQRACPYK